MMMIRAFVLFAAALAHTLALAQETESVLVCDGYNGQGNGLVVEIIRRSQSEFVAEVSLMENLVVQPKEFIPLTAPETQQDGVVLYRSKEDGLFRLEFMPPPRELGTRTGQGIASYSRSPYPRIGMGCSF
jgi:hypothetical protein